jgi:AcrR family transcriptional regulator
MGMPLQWWYEPDRPMSAPSASPPRPERRPRPQRATPRPRRGNPEETRARLVAAAAYEFNRLGYRGTDSNRIARAAGYAPGTFYKHFPDKRDVFLAAYEAWVTAEWKTVGEIVRQPGSRAELAGRLVDATIELHRRWRGLRASLRALVAEDAEARTFYRRQRRRQLEMLAASDPPPRGRARPRETDALLLYTLERVCDAIADGELRDLGLSVERTVALLRRLVAKRLR